MSRVGTNLWRCNKCGQIKTALEMAKNWKCKDCWSDYCAERRRKKLIETNTLFSREAKTVNKEHAAMLQSYRNKAIKQQAM